MRGRYKQLVGVPDLLGVTCVHMQCVVSCFYLQLQEVFSLLFSPQGSGPALVRAPTSELSLAQGIVNVRSSDPLPYAKLVEHQNG